jgi:adenosylcobinamide kinase/adenosylcobinamide-phosphate guanylyltransferase
VAISRNATVVPGYSGGPAADLHGIPLTESEAIIVLPMIHLVIGGARSGKSGFAERQALASGMAVTYVATGEVRDAEMAERIAHHRSRRPAGWTTVEEPLRLAEALARVAAPDRCLLVDCLTLWLTNAMLGEQEGEIGKLLTALPGLPGDIILVSNEVGWGIVPENALARRFRDEQGRLNQRVAAIADEVTLVAAGLPLALKSAG